LSLPQPAGDIAAKTTAAKTAPAVRLSVSTAGLAVTARFIG
jgi:hypothetical protein